MPIILASDRDFLDVMFLLSICTADMNRKSMFHWNRVYPDAETILSDIQTRTLYISQVHGVSHGMIVLNQDQADEYGSIEWEYRSGKTMVIHRLAVNPLFQHIGIGGLLMEFAIEHARSEGYDSIRLDVIQSHTPAAMLYNKMGFKEAGSFHFPFQKTPFICYELGL